MPYTKLDLFTFLYNRYMKLLCHFIKESIYTEELNLHVSMLSSISKMLAMRHFLVLYTRATRCPANCKTRLDREDYWIETLQTFYPYDLNERKNKADPNLPAGCSFQPFPGSRKRSA